MLRVKNESGQAVLIILLSLSVVLTIVLFIVSRSVTDISLSIKDEDSLRAFSAAEAGIEKALLTGSATGNTLLGDASFNASVTNYGQGVKNISYPFPLSSGDEATFWFAEHDSQGLLTCAGGTCFTGSNIRFCWGESGTAVNAFAPAIEASVYYTSTAQDLTTLKVARIAIDPYTASRNPANNFEAIGAGPCVIDGINFAFRKQYNLENAPYSIAGSSTTPGILQFVKIKMLYNTDRTHRVGIYLDLPGNTTLPKQGIKVDSLGKANQANRKVEVYKLFPEVPSIFDYAVFSKTGIVK